MTLTIQHDIISSDHTRHTARLLPGHEHAWRVSWLPGASWTATPPSPP
jgi:hypothetical protein